MLSYLVKRLVAGNSWAGLWYQFLPFSKNNFLKFLLDMLSFFISEMQSQLLNTSHYYNLFCLDLL